MRLVTSVVHRFSVFQRRRQDKRIAQPSESDRRIRSAFWPLINELLAPLRLLDELTMMCDQAKCIEEKTSDDASEGMFSES